MQVTITLNPKQIRALQALAARQNVLVLGSPKLTPEQFLQMNINIQLERMVAIYEEGFRQRVIEKFDTLTPQQQAQILNIMGIELPT